VRCRSPVMKPENFSASKADKVMKKELEKLMKKS
jgi:hypothetical protein